MPSLLCLKQLFRNLKGTRKIVTRKQKKVVVRLRQPKPEILEKRQQQDKKAVIEFIICLKNRGLIPVDNAGDGNCVFMSLAYIVLGDASKFEIIRYMIVYWLRNFPEKYQDIQDKYCDSMIVSGTAATMLELQVIADICFSVVECYSTENFLVPTHIIQPLRFAKTSNCTGRIRLWMQPGHCVALVDK